MGFSISWLAFQGKPKDDVLTLISLRDTGQVDQTNESPVSAALLPTGWYLVFCNHYRFVTSEALARLSGDCSVLACKVHEGAMVSGSCFYKNGHRVWSVTHESGKGIYDLSIDGDLPGSFAGVRDQLSKRQDNAAGDKPRVDYIFDIPVQLAADLCGYRHDKFNWGSPTFTRLELATK
jgi:hypothetical protein